MLVRFVRLITLSQANVCTKFQLSSLPKRSYTVLMVVEIKQDFWNLVSECPIRGVKCVKFVLKRFLKGFLTLICYQMDF